MPIARGEGVWLDDFEGGATSTPSAPGGSTCSATRTRASTRRSRAQLETARARAARGLHARARRRLSEALVKLVPAGPDALFLRRQRLGAVEVALKMSFHYWRNVGRSRASAASSRSRTATTARRSARSPSATSSSTAGLPAAADGRDHRALARLLRARAGRELGITQPADVRAMEAALARHADEVARSSSSRWCSAPAACACTTRFT